MRRRNTVRKSFFRIYTFLTLSNGVNVYCETSLRQLFLFGYHLLGCVAKCKFIMVQKRFWYKERTKTSILHILHQKQNHIPLCEKLCYHCNKTIVSKKMELQHLLYRLVWMVLLFQTILSSKLIVCVQKTYLIICSFSLTVCFFWDHFSI